MAKIVVSEFVSLDGVMEAPGGEPGYKHTNWVGAFPDHGQFVYKMDELREHDAHLLGRRTYESFAGAWPERSGEMADRINAMPKFVFSNTLQGVDWNNSTLLKGDFSDAMRRLKSDFDGILLVAGSHTLVKGLQSLGFVDEYHLMVFPIVLGSGFRVFEEADDKTMLDLTEVKQFGPIVNLTYQVKH
ncbi:MAG TPA: dihydrofolate reductase family protein [Dehalococcoidia bacterium]|nr:dihydrofolate reductase family protein [Dehalococcoidia bacterium]